MVTAYSYLDLDKEVGESSAVQNVVQSATTWNLMEVTSAYQKCEAIPRIYLHKKGESSRADGDVPPSEQSPRETASRWYPTMGLAGKPNATLRRYPRSFDLLPLLLCSVRLCGVVSRPSSCTIPSPWRSTLSGADTIVSSIHRE